MRLSAATFTFTASFFFAFNHHMLTIFWCNSAQCVCAWTIVKQCVISTSERKIAAADRISKKSMHSTAEWRQRGSRFWAGNNYLPYSVYKHIRIWTNIRKEESKRADWGTTAHMIFKENCSNSYGWADICRIYSTFDSEVYLYPRSTHTTVEGKKSQNRLVCIYLCRFQLTNNFFFKISNG